MEPSLLREATRFLLETIFNLFILAALTRFFMQALRASPRNPIAQFSIALTDFMVKPLRKLIFGFKGLDWASLVTAWIAEVILVLLLFAITSVKLFTHFDAISAALVLALVRVARLSLYLFMGAVIVTALMSWLAPYHPLRSFFDAFANPLLKPLQRRVPLIGGVDISPLIVLIGLQLIVTLPITWLETEIGKWVIRLAA